jgi:sulfide:quinone oxidoreductase
MEATRFNDTVSGMSRHPHPDHQPLRVLVAGAAVAGLETVVALRGLVGGAVATTLVDPGDDFAVHALDVLEPFGIGKAQRYPLSELAQDLDAEHIQGAIARVEHEEHEVHLQSGGVVPYDILVVAVGAFPYPAYAEGVCFERTTDPQSFDDVIADLRSGVADRLAIVVPPGCTWTLPAYELALMTAALVQPRELTLVTHEREPLEAFGAPGAELARTQLRFAGVDLLAGVEADVMSPTTVVIGAGARVTCDRVVHLPLLSGPNSPGLPHDDHGFILVDDAFAVRGADDVFAVGDAVSGPFKQGGLSSQQADAVAEQIAWRAGAEHPPRPYRPVLRGLLRTAHGPRYLRAEPPGGAVSAEVSENCLWWPPSKLAARWLTPWLAARDVADRPLPAPRRLPSGGLSWSLRG